VKLSPARALEENSCGGIWVIFFHRRTQQHSAHSLLNYSQIFPFRSALLASGLKILVDAVVAILQKRSLLRPEYSGRPLRNHFGLPKPPNCFAKVAPAAASA